MDMLKVLLIAVGGAAGTLTRYGTYTLLQRPMERTLFPFGTLAVNLLGCLVMGLLQGLFQGRVVSDPRVQVALTVGFLGGYTTFSAYGWDTTAFLEEKQYLLATVNVAANNVLGIGLVIVGYLVARPRP